MDTPTPAPAPEKASPPTAARRPQWVDRLVGGLAATLVGALWLMEAVLILLAAGGLAAVLWARSPDALPQTLHWAQRWLADADSGISPLTFHDARGSLTSGGRIGRLRWQQDGLTIEIEALDVSWRPRLWWQVLFERELSIDRLAAQRLLVRDERAAPVDDPPTPPERLTLPWFRAISVPLEAEALTYSGRTSTSVDSGRLVAHYRYAAQTDTPTHHVRVKNLVWADGQYRIEASLLAVPPLTLQIDLDATVETPPMADLPAQTLAVRAQLHGELAGPQALLEASADVRSSAAARGGTRDPLLRLRARLRPWSDMPLADAQLRLQDLDLAPFWPGGPTTRLDGEWRAAYLEPIAPHAWRWRLQGHVRNRAARAWNDGGLPLQRLDADLELRPDHAHLHALRVALGSGRLEATGQARWSTGDVGRPWSERLVEGQGRLALQGIEPQALWSTLPHGRIDGQAEITHTTVHTHWSVRLTPSAADAIGATPVPTVRASGTWARQRLGIDTLLADWLGSRLEAQGRVTLGAMRSVQGGIHWTAPGLEIRGNGSWPWAEGPLQASVELRDAQRFQQWGQRAGQALDAWLPGQRIAGRVQDLWRTPWQGQARFDLRAPGPVHPWQAALQGSATLGLPEDAWTLETTLHLSGEGLGDAAHRLRAETMHLRAWRAGAPLGVRLALAQPVDIRLTADGHAMVAAGALELQPQARADRATPPMAAQPARIEWRRLQWASGRLETEGRASPLAMSWVNAWLSDATRPEGPMASAGFAGDLMLEADWDLSLPLTAATAEPARAQVRWRHVGGELTYLAGSGTDLPRVAVELESLQANATLQGSDVRVQARVGTRRFGHVQGHFTTRLTPPAPDGSGWRWPGDAPLQGQLQAELAQLAPLSALMPPGWRIEGEAQLDARIRGIRAQPSWLGQLQLQQLAVRSAQDGIEFSDGQLLARLDGDQMTIERLQLRGAGGVDGGLLTGQGRASWSRAPDGTPRPEMTLSLQARSLRLLARADRRLTLSGRIDSRLSDGLLDLTGRLDVDQALLLLPDETTPRLGRDVVIRGSTAPVPLTARLPFRLRLRSEVHLGNRVEVRGLGLQTMLQGQLLVEAQPGRLEPILTGEVRTVRGSYQAYGQRLQIERGLIRFNGPYDNPSLDLLALRPHPTQKVGIEIGGTARAPRLRLYADPDMPDNEKLAWLVLGRPARGTGAEAAVIQRAALALLGNRVDDAPLAQRFGLDELDVLGGAVNPDGTTTPAALTLGKRLSDQLYVSYSRSLAGAVGTVAVFLDFSRHLTLRAQAGDENAVDIIFTRAFDGRGAPRTIPPASP
ncbi:translocation/assembly module TamB domain-containing protein [Tepidimonas sp.]|uniref:translocation/assembly module TamB domain-containing protein n=1 Tax=Tepidimonas sp. TaxID=2002775 RepID=UPI0028CBE93B|nr:translocation/assembly module TamB domain-containing protein [Tepidimonas sp.]MDT7928433.1 translocation/assembly module TamB domain-containing protein [Tepidimonas sp.]